MREASQEKPDPQTIAGNQTMGHVTWPVEIRLRCKDVSMPKPYPPEFRRDVVAVARKHEAPLDQMAKDFGISESCLANWLKKADVEEA